MAYLRVKDVAVHPKYKKKEKLSRVVGFLYFKLISSNLTEY